MTDEELQDRIERGVQAGSADERAYRRVFDVLQREPSLNVAPGFSTRVIGRMQPSTNVSRDFVWLIAGIVSTVIAMIVAIVMTEFRLNWGVFEFVSGNAGFIAFGIGFVLVLHWIDKRFVGRQMHRTV